MIHAIVGAIALSCVVAGFTLGAILIIESIIKHRKNK
jgi:hypothetical protein